MNKEKLDDLCKVLERVIVKTAEIYNEDSTSPTQKALLETIIGAAIWYLPGSNELYSGMISKSAEEKLSEGIPLSKLTKEHKFPRKLAGRELLSQVFIDFLNGEKKLSDLYLENYGKFNLVLSRENKDLLKFQKSSTFVDDETSYRNAKIELLERTIEQLRDLSPDRKRKPGKRELSATAQPAKGEFELLPELLNEYDEGGKAFSGIKVNDHLLVENGNPNRCYIAFMNYVINYYSESIPGSILLSKYIKTERNDPSFGADLKYPRVIRSSGNFFFSSHAGTMVKRRRIINIANELALQVSFLNP